MGKYYNISANRVCTWPVVKVKQNDSDDFSDTIIIGSSALGYMRDVICV